MQAMHAYFEEQLSNYQAKTPDEKMNRMVNTWNQYQCTVTYHMSRSASYFESGIGRGMGFRDSTQDLLGFVHIIPELARERILDIAATQMEDGSRLSPVSAPDQEGQQRHRHRLQRRPAVADLRRGGLHQGDRRLNRFWTRWSPIDCDASKAKPLIRPPDPLLPPRDGQPRVPHGLPLIGRADWNDCLNLNCFSKTPRRILPDHGQLRKRRGGIRVHRRHVRRRWARTTQQLCTMRGLDDEAAFADVECKKMYEHSDEGRLGRQVVPARLRRLRQQDRLPREPRRPDLHRAAGLLRHGGHRHQGRPAQRKRWIPCAICSTRPMAYRCCGRPTRNTMWSWARSRPIPRRYKENGGIFCHNNPWITIAETMIGRGDRALSTYQQDLPGLHGGYFGAPPH